MQMIYTYTSTNPQIINEIENNIPQMLLEYNLKINQDKTEKYTVPKPPPPLPPPPTLEELIQHKMITYDGQNWTG